jgi:glutamyl/glutaminyl-tRNA synthetase
MPAKLFTKTRIAPTPSGYLHLGNVLSFAISITLAQKHGAKVFLRIDDIDQARANKLYVQDIFDTLNFLNMPWDKGPRDAKDFEADYSQSHRMNNYAAAMDKFRDNGSVFACTCSRRQIDSCNCAGKNISLNTPNASWRLLTAENEISVNDYNGQIIKAALPADMKNFIVRKKDGFPAYQLTSIVDDLLFGIDLVVRGADLWPSTLAQYQVAAALDKAGSFDAIMFYHHPLIMADSGQKLSKSAGATSIKYLRESGKSATDVYALISGILGIAPTTNWQQLGEALLS